MNRQRKKFFTWLLSAALIFMLLPAAPVFAETEAFTGAEETSAAVSAPETVSYTHLSHVADMERYGIITATMERLGYKVVLGRNIQKNTFGYAASAEERASDLNAMVADKSVQMVLFGGGESAVEILPYIDYENIRRYPKLFSSYSDGTSILNAIYAQTGLLTYYGCGPGEFADLRYYDYTQFISHFIEGCEARHFARDSRWKILCAGSCDGILIGGYAPIVGLMLSNKYFNYDGNQKYILFLEDHEKFSCVGAVSTYLAFIEQSEFINNVAGLIFGHYSPNPPDALLYCLCLLYTSRCV